MKHHGRPLPFLSALFAILTGVILIVHVAANQETAPKGRLADGREHLKPLNSMIGDWRGVGQVKRGSRAGAWTEKVSCVWDFSDKRSAVVLNSEGGQQFDRLRLRWDALKAKVVLEQKIDGTTRVYRGVMPKKWPGKLLLTSTADADNVTYRCTIQQLKDIRATILFEKQTSAKGSFRRIVEVGYTRAGARLAEVGGGQRKCIVTGGLGTIAVMHKGQTYYVCCQGCVQAFNESPDAIIAEYQASLKRAQ